MSVECLFQSGPEQDVTLVFGSVDEPCILLKTDACEPLVFIACPLDAFSRSSFGYASRHQLSDVSCRQSWPQLSEQIGRVNRHR